MKNSKVSDILYYLLLILLLCISSFLVLFYEASAYEKMNNVNETYDNCHLVSSYLSNKMRSGKNCKSEDNKLIIENDDLVTYIYLYDNNLYELTTLKNMDINLSSGEKIFRVDKFNTSNNDGKIIVNYTVDDKDSEVVYALRSGKHE